MSAEQRREQLLDVTKALVDRAGWHGVSIEAVARDAGISRPIVYGHFGDLEGLLRALVERESIRALAQLTEILPAGLADGDPREQLLEGLAGYLEAARTEPVRWRLVVLPSDSAPAVLREQIERGRAAVLAQLAAALEGAGVPDPELTARSLSTVSDEAVRLLLTDPGRYPPERLLAHAAWMLDFAFGRSTSAS
jgi:AcrR family transcriptional regulator